MMMHVDDDDDGDDDDFDHDADNITIPWYSLWFYLFISVDDN